MRDTIDQVTEYYFKKGKAVMFRTDDKRNIALAQAYHGYDITNGRLINMVVIELPSVSQPIMASNKDRKIIAAHVEQLGDVNYKVPSQLAMLVFYCEEENLWYRMNFIQLKEYWITKSLRAASIKDLEQVGLVTMVRNTAYGPDILGMIDQPFQVITSRKEWFEEVYI